MYAIVPKKANKNLLNYVSKPIIKAIAFNGNSYTLNGKCVGGLLPALTKKYYPDYLQKKRQHRGKRLRKASTRKQGIAIDNQLEAYVRDGKRPRNQLAKAIVAYLEDQCGHTIQAAQMPVVIRFFDGIRISQADIITEDSAGRLYMVEVKSGYNQSRSQGVLTDVEGDVDNNRKNHWELQRHYTHRGLVEGGLPIEASYVLNVYQEGKRVTVKKRKNPAWVSLI
jgi:hypothetical protein